MSFSRTKRNNLFLEEFEGDVDHRAIATGEDSYLFRVLDAKNELALLKIFSGTHERAANNDLCPKKCLEWYFNQMKFAKSLLEKNSNPLNQSFEIDGITYDLNYLVSDPGDLIERSGILGSIITDVRDEEPASPRLLEFVEEIAFTYIELLDLQQETVILLPSLKVNARFSLDRDKKILTIIFTDLANSITALYRQKNHLL